MKNKLLTKKSIYQKIDIIEDKDFGKILFLDNDLQIAEKDACIYNKSLVTPITKANKLNKVLILGGGDGGVLHEVLKYNPKEIILVDIDKEVIKASKEFLFEIHNGAFNDHRVKVIINDANKFLKTSHNFDAIIYDLTMNPEHFTTKNKTEFFNDLLLKIKKNLKKKGVISIQCCSESDKETKKFLEKTLSKHFKNIKFKSVFIPSFNERWVFASAQVRKL